MSEINKIKKKDFWLEKFDFFSISGKDSKRFLNGLTTGNIINPKDQILKTCWLSPNGILKSLLEIKFQENKIDIISLEGDINKIKQFFNDVIFPTDDVLISDSFSLNRFQEIDEINSWKIIQPIYFKSENQEYELFKKNINILNINKIKSWKINQAIPSLDNEINGKNNPMELGLVDLLDFNKGCYLGQETISKIKNVSSLKQEIRVWTAQEFIVKLNSDDRKIYIDSSEEKSVGYITSFCKFDSEIKGLAMIKRKYLESNLSFFSKSFGQIEIKKSIGSTFLD